MQEDYVDPDDDIFYFDLEYCYHFDSSLEESNHDNDNTDTDSLQSLMGEVDSDSHMRNWTKKICFLQIFFSQGGITGLYHLFLTGLYHLFQSTGLTGQS